MKNGVKKVFCNIKELNEEIVVVEKNALLDEGSVEEIGRTFVSNDANKEQFVKILPSTWSSESFFKKTRGP